MIGSLIDNSKSAMISAIEIHNKPIFSYRYEIVTILLINSWELILKAYLLKYKPEIKVIKKDGTTKPFEECLSCVESSIGLSFFSACENLKKVYEYRCNCIHFFQDDINIIIYSLVSKSVEFYSKFLFDHFEIDLSDQTNLILLPIGFKKPISPLIYLSNNSSTDNTSTKVKEFMQSIIKSTNVLIDNSIDEAILVDYKVSLINENRIKNADIRAAITNDKNQAKLQVANILPESLIITSDASAKKIILEEDKTFSLIYTETYDSIKIKAKSIFEDFSVNKKFHSILNSIKNNPTFHKKRFLDAVKNSGMGKDYYTKAVYDELGKSYTRKLI